MGYAVALFVSALAAAAIAAFAWDKKGAPGSGGLLAAMTGLSIWAAAYAVRWLASTDAAAIFWLDATYLGVVIAPSALLCLAVQFSRGDNAITVDKLALLAVEPVVTLILIWTDPYHGLFYGGRRTAGAILQGGIWFYVNAAYSYALNFISIWILLKAIIRSRGLYRRQGLIILVGVVLPWIGNIMSIAGLSPLEGLDLTPFLFTLSGMVFAYGLYRYRLLDLVPIARDFLVERMSEGLVVVDSMDRIVDINPSAKVIFGVGDKVLGQVFSEVLAQWKGSVLHRDGGGEGRFELVTEKLRYEVQASGFNEAGFRRQGKIFVIRDVTEQRAAMEELKYRSSHDVLTGLSNRQSSEVELARLEKSNESSVIFMVDLDGLKDINDTYGHAIGDEAIRDTALLLARVAQTSSMIARVGGDEFLIIARSMDEDAAKSLADALLEEERKFNEIQSLRYGRLGFSIGWAIRREGESVIAALKRADDAMYAQKRLRQVGRRD
jgi:diguanylate cyclase (GGDEF)-like protein